MSEDLGKAIADLQYQAGAANNGEYKYAVGHTHYPTGPLKNTIPRQAEEIQAGLASITETSQALVANLRAVKEAAESAIASTSASKDTASTILGEAAGVLHETSNGHAQDALNHFRSVHEGFTEAASSTTQTDSGAGEALNAAVELAATLGSAATILTTLNTALEPLPGHAITAYDRATGADKENREALRDLARYREDLGIGDYEPLL